MTVLRILHISDLHIKSTGEAFDRSVVLEPLIKRVAEDIESGIRPELVIVTGDIAYSGKEAEYKLAKEFFDELLEKLKLPSERLFMVPGNHDVDRKKYRPTDVPFYDDMSELNYELENEDFRNNLLKGMNDRTTLGDVVSNYALS
jgi:3',5'-cyclic AMP phosphodiesterase CpdA